MVKEEDFSQSNDSNSSSSSQQSSSSTSSSAQNSTLNDPSLEQKQQSSFSINNANNKYNLNNFLPLPSNNNNQNNTGGNFNSFTNNTTSLLKSTQLNTFNHNNSFSYSGMQNLTNQLVIAAAAVNNPLDVTYLKNEMSNPYNLPAAALHSMFNAAAQHQHNSSMHQRNSSSSNSSKESSNTVTDKLHDHGGRTNGDGEIVGPGETVRKREMRLLKNREAARECRRKKKEYIKCLENRVAVLETQNKTLIDELKSLKALYCQNDTVQNH